MVAGPSRYNLDQPGCRWLEGRQGRRRGRHGCWCSWCRAASSCQRCLVSCSSQSRSLDRFWATTTWPTAAASRCSWVTWCIGGACFVTRLRPWCTLGLASPEAREACRERLVRFVQFELKLSHYTTTSCCLHLHVGMETF